MFLSTYNILCFGRFCRSSAIYGDKSLFIRKKFFGGVMDYDYLSSVVSNYSNLTSLNSLSGGMLGSASALASLGSSLDVSDSTSALASANSFSSILGMVMKSDLLGQTAASEDSPESIANELAEEAKDRLISIAGAGSDGTAEGEARSNLILQNYLYTAMMKDSLDNSLTDKADFTSGLFSDLAVGTDDEEGSSALSSLRNSALSAISSYSNSSYTGQGSLLKEMLTSLSNDLQNI